MTGKRFRKSLKGKLARVFGSRTASPAPSHTPSTASAWPSEPQDSRSIPTPPNDAANACTALGPSDIDAIAVRAVTEGAKEDEASATIVSDVPFPAVPNELPTRTLPAPEPEEQIPRALSVSQTLWNTAYDSRSTPTPPNNIVNTCTALGPSDIDATAVRAVTEGAKEDEASATIVSDVPFPALPDELPARTPPAPEPEEQIPRTLSISQTLWNAAYDSLEEDIDTTELVRSYVKTLMEVSGVGPGTDVSAELKDTTQRQMHMRELVEKGKAKISTSSRATKAVGDVAQFILTVKPIIDTAIQNIPQAALPWAGVCAGLQILLNPAKATRSNLAGIAHVVSRMDWYCALSEHLLEEDHVDEPLESISPLLKERVIDLYKALLLYQMKSVCSYYRRHALDFLRALANWDDWDAYLNAVQDAEKCLLDDWSQVDKIKAGTLRRELAERAKRIEELLGTISQDIREFIALQKEMRRDAEDTKCLRELFVVDPQDDMEKIEQKKDVLLHEAYKWILDTEAYAAFTDWNHDGSTSPSCRLLWVKGHAGTGKTMLLMGMIRELSSQSASLAPYVSHFFCQGTEQSLNSAMATLRSLIWLLLVQQPHLISYLRSKYKNTGSSLFRGDNAFIALSGVLKSMLKDPRLSPVYFIVDALDECEEGLPALLQLISASLAFTEKVKWLVSSRPIVQLKTPGTAGALVELDTQKLERPVSAYIDHKLSALVGQPGYTNQILDRLSVEVTQRAENTFLWVWFFFQELGKKNRVGKPLLNGKDALPTIQKFPSGLSSLYGRIMDMINTEVGYPEYCKDALSAVVLASRPLALCELAVLAGLPSDMARTIVEDCGSFLTVKDETVYLIHQSAKDYLDENYSAKLQPGGVAQGHVNVARRSIRAMSSILKRNIYNLDLNLDLRSRFADITPPKPDPLAPIRYSCVFWASHFLIIRNSPEFGRELSDDGVVFQFLKERFLYWLESLSILGKVSVGFASIRRLWFIVKGLDTSSRLARLLRDVVWFFQPHWEVLGEFPLQVYGIALVFTPAMSEIKCAHWGDRLPFIETTAGVPDHWGISRKMLDEVKVVVFSPDGKSLATASGNLASKTLGFTIHLWDPATGICRQTLQGPSHRVEIIAFSPDGKTLVSVSDDCTIQIWDATTGAHRQTIKGYSNSVRMIAFSPDSKLLASNSEDCMIQLWNVATGMCQQTLSGDSNQVQAVAFSADGEILASCSHHHTIRLWDVTTGVCRQMHTKMSPSQLLISDQDRRVQVVAFSPDGKTLASGADDGSVLLWDITTGVCRQRLSGTRGQVSAVAFSPDGKTLAVGLRDRWLRDVVQLWGPVTGIYRGTVITLSPLLDLSFSEDSRYLKTNRELIRVPSTLVFSDDRHNHVVGVSGGPGGGLMMDGKCVLPLPRFATGRVAILCGDTVVLIMQENDWSCRPIFLRLKLCKV